ncbi:MAG: thioesterase family protein [Gulosibacter sp.]|uniref:thioesterase family protein n=1 Tax=Gulosibacter sp. TaxID=2817531 RepID=UPI003F933452
MSDTSTAAYFTRESESVFVPTEHSGGAWRDDELHLAPVAGLVIQVMDQWRLQHKGAGMLISRVSLEVLGQIMREPMTLHTEVIRPGRTIELIETTATIGERAIIRGRAWLLQASGTAVIEGTSYEPMPNPDTMPEFDIQNTWPGGFISSLQAWASSPTAAGRGRAWLRSELPLVAGEVDTPLAHFARVLDAANGVAVREDPGTWMFPNVDFTLHLFRQPTGDWTGLDVTVSFGPSGQGLTSSVVHDLDGPVGTLQQSLTLRPLV